MKEVPVRSLDHDGVERFRTLLDEVRRAGDPGQSWQERQDAFRELAVSENAREIGCEAVVNADLRFKSRFECGRYLVDALGTCERARVDGEPGLWTWLALLWLDQLLPRDKGGRITKVLNDENFIAGDLVGGRAMWKTWHRHAIRTSYLLVREHGDVVDFILHGPMHERGEFVEQLTGRADLVICRPVIRAAAILYRREDGTPRRGATSTDHARAPVRRFAALMHQYMVNWDLHAMSPERIVEMLPPEFDRFRKP